MWSLTAVQRLKQEIVGPSTVITSIYINSILFNITDTSRHVSDYRANKNPSGRLWAEMIWTALNQRQPAHEGTRTNFCTWTYEALLAVRPDCVRSSVVLKSLHLPKVYTFMWEQEKNKKKVWPLVQLQNPCCSSTNQRSGWAGEGYEGTRVAGLPVAYRRQEVGG